MERIAAEEGLNPRILLEVNLAGEASKHGFCARGIATGFGIVLSLGRLTVEGLMTIPPLAPGAGGIAPLFCCPARTTRPTRNRVSRPVAATFHGMSDDFPIAIEEGATLVRVGTAIFGQRLNEGEGPFVPGHLALRDSRGRS